MKSRTVQTARPAAAKRRFVLHPLSFAICLALSGAAVALPQGGKVVNGTATISTPAPGSTVITQTTDKAIIDWQSFSVAAGEKVRFYQPSNTSITLNRVTGYDPSVILGQMSSNGRIFLLNPNGVIFGAGARIDVGGLVASTLSMSNNDFLASRYSLTSVDASAPAQRGVVRNDGTINAPGGTVVLAGPTVVNTGAITADRGRVGMAAANAVLVDVEGDGLIFFQTSATQAKNRLDQLGRVQADGGSVELRAAARGAFADTVLNMTGVVQAKSIGTHGGRIVIDGGSDGVTAVSGSLLATGLGAGEHGGAVTVQGQKVLLDNGSVVDASGDAGGGAIRVGGGFHGADADVRNADATIVATGAQLHADAVTRGDGGTVAIWADGSTRYWGNASVKGGAQGGNGGSAEVSGKNNLAYEGFVDATAPLGKVGTLLLDPTDITIAAASSSPGMGVSNGANKTFSDTTTATGTSVLSVTVLQAQLGSANVIVDATLAATSTAPSGGTITVAAPISWTSNKDLTLKAATDITVNAGNAINATGTGSLNLFADGNVTLLSAVSLAGGSFKVAGTAGGATRATSFTSGAGGTITTSGSNSITGGNVTIATSGDQLVGNIATVGGSAFGGILAADGGNVSLSTSNGAISTGTINTGGGNGLSDPTGAVGGNAGNVTLVAAGAPHAISVGAITAVGGKGSDNASVDLTGGTGGAGGTVSISNASTGNTTTLGIDTTGGVAGAAGSGDGVGGQGGNAGAISVNAAGGTLAIANIKAVGGAGSIGNGTGAPGAAGAGQAVALNFGQNAAGTLDLSGSTSLQAASVTATGGAGTDTIIVAAGAAENLVLANALLTRPTGGNVVLASVENAIVGTGSGTTTLTGWTGGRTATVLLTAGAGTIAGNGAGTTLQGPATGSSFTVSGADSGTAAGTTFSAVGHLVGGAGADSFVISNAGSLSGNIDGGAGANSLDLSARTVANFGLSSANSGSASGLASGYVQIATLIGNSTTSTLTGTNTGSTYSVTGAGVGTVNDGVGTTSFSGIAALVGGTGADTFSLTTAGTLVAGIDGGAGSNTLDLSTRSAANFGLSTASAGSVSGVAGGYTNVGTLIGNNTTSTLTGTNTGSTYSVTGAGVGAVNDGVGTTSFSGIAALVGGTGADTFSLTTAGTLVAGIDGGAGSNTLDLSTRSAANFGLSTASAGSVSGVAGGYTNVGTLIGNNTTSTLTGTSTGSTYTVTSTNGGSVNDGVGTTVFSGMPSLVGGIGADAFIVGAGFGITRIDGGATGTNSLTVTASGAENLTLVDALLTRTAAGNITLANLGAATLNGSAGANTIDGSGWNGTLSLSVTAGTDVLKGNGIKTTLVSPAAGATINLTGPDSGTVGAGTSFSQVGNLAGGAGPDTFAIAAAGTLSGNLTGAGGNDTLDLGGKSGAITISQAGTISGSDIAGTISGIANVVGNGANTSFLGSNAGQTYTVSGANTFSVAGQTLSGVGSIVAGSGADTFVLQSGGTLAGSINGGAGANTLDLSAKVGAVGFSLTSATSGSATGVTGGFTNVSSLVGNGASSTLTGTAAGSTYSVTGSNTGTVNDGVGTTSFSAVASLIGGNGADVFVIANAGTLSGTIDAGAGMNMLDLSARGVANVGLTSASSGTASGLTGGYSHIDKLIGNDTGSTLTGTATGSTYAVTGANTGTVNDGVGATAFSGFSSLAGGTGANVFTIANAGTLSGSVNGGAGANTLDLSAKVGAVAFGLTGATSGSATGVTGGYGNVATLIGNGTTTSLTGSNTGSTFSVTGTNAGTVNDGVGTTTFSSVGSLAGGNGADSFVIATAGALGGSIDGGAGANTLNLSARTVADFVLTTASSGTASGVGAGYLNVGTLAGNGGTSTLTGRNVGSTFAVTGDNAGNVNDGSGTTAFSGMPHLVGGTAADTFVVGAGFALASIDGGPGAVNAIVASANPTLADVLTLSNAQLSRSGAGGNVALANIGVATLIGGAGNNVIDATGWTAGRTVTLQLSAGTDVLTGNGANTTLLAAATGGTINVTSADAGTFGTSTFTGVGNLQGAAGVDTFSIANTATLSGNITGSGGNDTLNLSGRTGTVTISQSGATTGSGVAGTISGVTGFVGNGANTTFLGSNTGQTYSVTGANAFSVGGQTLVGVGNIIAGSGADSFVVANAGSLAGSIDGGGGSNTLDLSAKLAAVGFSLTGASSGSATGTGGFANVGTLIGNGALSILTGSSTGSTFAVSASNAGTVNDGVSTTSFSGIGSLTGGAGADVFVIANAGSLTGSVNGGGGVNTLDLSARTTASFGQTSASSGTASGVAGGYTATTNLIGNGTTSVLTGTNAGSVYAVTGPNAGTVDGTTSFSGIATLTGGTGADSIAIANSGSLSGSVNGGAGANTLDLSARTTGNFNLTTATSGTASGVAGGYSNVASLVGNGTSSTVTGTNAGSAYAVTTTNAGTVNDGVGTTSYSGVASLIGGGGADSFTIATAGSLAGNIDGGAGSNTLNLSARAVANFALTSASAGTVSGVAGTYSNIATLAGNGTSATLGGSNAASTFSVTSNNGGTVNDGVGTTIFTGMPNLKGGTGADSFVIGAGFALGSIDGGAGAANSLTATAGTTENLTLSDTQLGRSAAGNVGLANLTSATLMGGAGNNTIDASGWTAGRTVTVHASAGADTVVGNGVGTTLVGTAAPSTFNLTGADSGTLTDGTNVTTLSGVGNFTGGAANDTFLIQNAGTLTGNLDGGTGLNTLDLSNKSSATIVFNTSGNSVTGVGIAGSLTNIGNLIGNSTNTTLQGDATGQSFAITANNQITVGGSQVFQGVGNLQAGTGADSFTGTTFKLSGNISDAGGTSTLSGTIRTDGSQTYVGPVVAPAVTLIALGGLTATNAANDFGTVSLTGGAINVSDANAINLSSVVVGAGQALTITSGSAITLNGNVTTTANQTYAGDLLLAGNAVLSAGAGTIRVQGNVDGGAHDLTLTSAGVAANALSLGASVGNVGVLTAGGNLTLGGNVTSTGTQTYAGTLALANNAILDTGAGKVDLHGAVDGGGHSLTVSSSNAAADAIHVGGNVANTVQFTANGLATLAGNVVTTGHQSYAGAVVLATDVLLDAGAGSIGLQGGVNGASHALTLSSTSAAPDAIDITGASTNLGVFTVGGNASLGGNVTSAGTQTYTGSVTLTGNTTLDAGAARLNLNGAVDAGGHGLGLTSSNAAADAIHAGATITNASQLIVTGKSTLASGVTTSGAQTYSDTVTLGSSLAFSGSSLGFGNGIVAGAFDLGLRTDTLTIAGALIGTGKASVSTATQGASVGVAGGAGTLQLSQVAIDRFSTFGSLTLGRVDGTGDMTFGNLSLPTHLVVQSGSGNADFTGSVTSAAGQARTILVSTGGTTTFAGAVGGAIGGTGALGSLGVTGATVLDASVTTTASQSYGGPVTIGGATTLSASSVTAGGGLSIGGNAVTVFTDALSVAGPVVASATGTLRVAPHDASGTMGVAGGAGTLQVSQALLDTLAAVPTLTLGRSDGSGTISVANVVLPTNLVIGSGSGNVAFSGSLDSAAGPARDITVNTTGTTSFSGTIGATRAIDTLTVSGASQIGANITSSGGQNFVGAATITSDSALSGPSVSFGSTVDGAHSLAVNAAATRFAGAVGSTVSLTSLTTDAVGTTRLGGNVTTTGSQTYNDAVLLDADATLTGSSVKLAGTVDGAHALGLAGSSGVTIGAALGGTTQLTSVSVTGPLQVGAGTIRTTGTQTYAEPVTLGTATSLSASSLSFGSTVDGRFDLALQSPGTASFAANIGATAALASLNATGGGTVRLSGASVDTTGAQNYSGALQLTGSSRLTGSSLTLTGPVSGATDLSLQTNALSGATSMSGTGVLSISSLDPGLSIGIVGGPGALQISRAVLDGATGFKSEVIGRVDGTGTVSAGNLILRSDTVLQTGTGNIDLAGSVDGAFALTLNSGGTTRIAGPVGTTTALTSLVTDNNAAAPDWNGTTGERTVFDTADGTGKARIVTTGAQSYNDPLTVSVAISFAGGAITATQATNSFSGTVSAAADTLQLHSATDLKIGNVTLTHGGAIEADGVMHLSGALQLNGSTLVLTSNATPTPIDITDPDYAGKTVTFGFVPIKEASGTIVEDTGATVGSVAGSLIAFRSPKGGTISLEQTGNALLGSISAVSGLLGDNDTSRFSSATAITLGFIRIVSSEIHVAGSSPTNGDQTLVAAGLEGDAIKVTADVLTTGTDGLIRARLPFNNIQGSQTSLPGLTLVMTPQALAKGGSFGGPSTDGFIRIQIGGLEGGFITALPKGASGDNAVIFLGGAAAARPFYDGNGKITEIRIFYNGDAPRTPQEAGALAAVIALIEEARHARFEEAVRTENVSSRLRSGVIAEVGAGRPATVGRESIRQPDVCEVKDKTLECNES